MKGAENERRFSVSGPAAPAGLFGGGVVWFWSDVFLAAHGFGAAQVPVRVVKEVRIIGVRDENTLLAAYDVETRFAVRLHGVVLPPADHSLHRAARTFLTSYFKLFGAVGGRAIFGRDDRVGNAGDEVGAGCGGRRRARDGLVYASPFVWRPFGTTGKGGETETFGGLGFRFYENPTFALKIISRKVLI